MKTAGYPESIRISVTENILKKYSERLERENSGVSPMYRNKTECIKDKQTKGVYKTNWFNKGKIEYDAVLKVPATPGSSLSARVRKKLDQEVPDIKILVQEKVGVKVMELISNSRDPWKKIHCNRETCVLCNQGRLGECWTSGVTYRLECKTCEEDGKIASYTGESGRSAHTRQAEHARGLNSMTRTA